MSSSSASGSVAPSSPKRARGSVGELQARGEVQEMTAIVTSNLFQRLTQLEVRVTDAERTAKTQGDTIAQLTDELFTVKNKLIMSEGRLRALEADESQPVRAVVRRGYPPSPDSIMADILDDDPLLPARVRAANELLHDTSEEEGDAWGFRGAEL